MTTNSNRLTREEFRDSILRWEGVDKVSRVDVNGNLTAGMGRNLEKHPELKAEYPEGTPVPTEVWQAWAVEDLEEAYTTALDKMSHLEYDKSLHEAIGHMNYNLGNFWDDPAAGDKYHPKTSAFLKAGDRKSMSEEIYDSDWYREGNKKGKKGIHNRVDFISNLLYPKDKARGGFINMQEGGNVENTEQTGFLAPSLTSEVLPDETVDTSPSYESPRTVPSVNTDEGFYASNPAPGETMDEFTRRTTRYELFNENQIESQWLKPFPILEQTSYTPPEDYVSPRISNPFGSVFGYDGDSTGDFTDPNRFPKIPDTSDDFTTEKAIIETFGTYSDAMVAYEASKNLHGKDFNAWAEEIYGYINQGVGVSEALTLTNFKNYYPDTLDLEEKRTQYALDKAYGYIDENGNVSEKFTDSEGNTLPADTEKENKWDSVENWFEDLGKRTLYTSEDQTFNLTIGNIADDAFVALMTEFFTGDTEKALIAGAGSFTATNVTEMAVNKVWAAGIPENLKETFNGWLDKGYTFEESAALAFNRDGTEAGKAAFEELSGHAKNMNALMSSTATMLTSLALGADMEQVLLDGASTAAIALGTDVVGTKLLETFGSRAIEDYASSTIAGVGGGTLSALVALIRTGDIKQAAISGLAGGLLAAGNPLGWAVMGVQLLMGLGKKPSNKSGYASFDFDKFEMNQYSQGDYDPSKANDDNVEFSRSLMEPLIPYLKSLEESTGFDFKGDLQIHYSEASQQGIYYTLSDIKQEGLTAEQMFLNRLDYFEGRDQSTQDGGKVYRRRFEATEQGIADMYEAIMADLQYIAENQMSDIKYFTGIKKSQEQIQQEFKDSGFDISTFRGIRQGGKISLDKGGNVQYNKGNYGLVNKKGKAPPSARADDVPMTLKEGDYVLSQPAVALYGKDTINRMLSRAATKAGKNLKSGGKVPVNVHNGEYIIPKNLTEYIGPNVLETMNNRGLMSVGERPNT